MRADEDTRSARLERELSGTGAAREGSRDDVRALLDTSAELAVLVAMDGTVLEANETALRMLNVTRDAFVGRNVYDFFPPHVAEGRRAMATEVVRTRKALHQLDMDGPRILDNFVVPLFDEAGEVHRLAVYARDITRQFRAERAERDEQQRAYEREKTEALRRLASDVAHEFNNLLTPIVTYLRLAKAAQGDGSPPREGEARCPLLDSALDSAERATELVARVVRTEVDGGRPAETVVRRASSRAPAPDGALNVLAVDDEAGVLQVVEVALLMAGHQVSCFDTAEEGLRAFLARPASFQAAILDQNLRDGSGIELAERIREQAPDLLIVLASGRPTSELRRSAEALQLRLLAKPFSVESLQGALADA